MGLLGHASSQQPHVQLHEEVDPCVGVVAWACLADGDTFVVHMERPHLAGLAFDQVDLPASFAVALDLPSQVAASWRQLLRPHHILHTQGSSRQVVACMVEVAGVAAAAVVDWQHQLNLLQYSQMQNLPLLAEPHHPVAVVAEEA